MNFVLRLTEAAVEFIWWGGWGLQSHFCVQPNHCVKVVLCCVVVGVVTTKFENNWFVHLLKSPIFVVQKAAAPKNGVIRYRLAMPYNDVRRCLKNVVVVGGVFMGIQD